MKIVLYRILSLALIFLLIFSLSVPTFSDEITENEENAEDIVIDNEPSDIEIIDETVIDIFDPAFDNFTLKEKLLMLRDIFPHEHYWNGKYFDGECAGYLNISTLSCSHNSGNYSCNTYNGRTKDHFPWANNIQCLGFASMISDFLFGKDAEIEVFYDYDLLEVGDHIRLTDATHSMIVTEKTDKFIKVVECNADYNSCIIKWDREISKDALMNKSGGLTFFKRVP